MTNQELYNLAALELKIIESGGSLDATDSADMMTICNQMLAAWKVSDMDLQYFPQDTLTDDSPIPVWAEQGVISNLAVKAAASFDATVSQLVFDKAQEGEELIGRTLINLNLEKTDMTHLPQGVDVRYNIITDA